MPRKILIMGLPGAGKTTLARELAPLLRAVLFNADEVRQNLNRDLGFSPEDRIEQARRMGWLCDRVVEAGHVAIADFICPTAETRAALGPAFTVWLDRINAGRYADTNQLFVPPERFDIRVESEGSPGFWAERIIQELRPGLESRGQRLGPPAASGGLTPPPNASAVLRQITEPHHHRPVGGDDGADLGWRQGFPPLTGLTRAEEFLRCPRPLVKAVQFLLPGHFAEGGFLNRTPKLLRICPEPQKCRQASKAALGRREHIFIAQQQYRAIWHRHPARRMKAPGTREFPDAPRTKIDVTGRIGHMGDNGIEGQAGIMRIGHSHVERVAHDIDRGQRNVEIDCRKTFHSGDSIMGLDIDWTFRAAHEIGLDLHPRLGDFPCCGLMGRLPQPALEALLERLACGHFMEGIDVLRALAFTPQLPQQIVNEDPDPGIAGFGIGSDPYRPLPKLFRRGISASCHFLLTSGSVQRIHRRLPTRQRTRRVL